MPDLTPDVTTTPNFDPGRVAIASGWLVYDVGYHTCGGYGPESGYAHEPGCGAEPMCEVADIPDLLAAAAERDALAAKLDAVRALHTPVRYYTDPCDDPECEREFVELSVGDYYHADTFELMCEVCSGGDLSECDYDDAVPHPCPTIRALDATPDTGGES